MKKIIIAITVITLCAISPFWLVLIQLMFWGFMIWSLCR